jgi:hypothetical protein
LRILGGGPPIKYSAVFLLDWAVPASMLPSFAGTLLAYRAAGAKVLIAEPCNA